MIKRVEFFNREQKIDGLLYLNNKAPLVIICHGFTVNKNNKFLAHIAKMLHKAGFSVLMFDFRGSGASEGEFTTLKEEVSDFKEAVKFAKKFSKKLIFLGHSLGATIVTLSRLQARGIILINPELSFELTTFNFMRKVIPQFFIRRAFKKIDNFAYKKFENLSVYGKFIAKNFRFMIGEEFLRECKMLRPAIIRNIRSPVLFIQSRKDKIVFPKGTRKAFELARKPKEFFLIEGDHKVSKYAHKMTATKKILVWLANLKLR